MTPLHLNAHIQLIDLVNWSFNTLQNANLDYGHGFLDAYDEAVYCVLYTLNLPLHDLKSVQHKELTEAQITNIKKLVQNRAKTNQPLAYLVKQAYMHGLSFYVDERVLVPRSFLGEVFVEHMLEDYLDDVFANKIQTNALNVLELCTGSACLSILFKHTYQKIFKKLHIDATDICPNALAVAQHNINQYHYNDSIMLYEGSLFANIKPAKQYDIIFSNPPYVCTQSMENLPKAYLYEPHIALAGGLDGMDLVKPIIKQASQYLTNNGLLIIEIGNEYEYAMAMFDAMNIESVCWLGVSAGHQQVFLLQAWQIRHLR